MTGDLSLLSADTHALSLISSATNIGNSVHACSWVGLGLGRSASSSLLISYVYASPLACCTTANVFSLVTSPATSLVQVSFTQSPTLKPSLGMPLIVARPLIIVIANPLTFLLAVLRMVLFVFSQVLYSQDNTP